MTVRAKSTTRKCAVVQLYPISYLGDIETTATETGLLYGIACNDDSVISWLPVRIPPLEKVEEVSACAELTTSSDDDATCVLRWRYMDRGGDTRELYTTDLPAEGDIARVPIPMGHIDPDTAFTCALRVVPTSKDNLKRPVPIMIRSAWIEIDYAAQG